MQYITTVSSAYLHQGNDSVVLLFLQSFGKVKYLVILVLLSYRKLAKCPKNCVLVTLKFAITHVIITEY